MILVGLSIICLMSNSIANDFSNLLAVLFPSKSMLKSPRSTIPFLSKSMFAKKFLRESIKIVSFMSGGLYVTAIKSGLNFGLLTSIHNNCSLFAASSFLTRKGIVSRM